MGVEDAAPCRHRGAPPEAVVAQVVRVIQAIGEDHAYLHSRGLSAEEYRLALPVAIEQMRGRSSASNKERRAFLALVWTIWCHPGRSANIPRRATEATPFIGLPFPASETLPSSRRGAPTANTAALPGACPTGR